MRVDRCRPGTGVPYWRWRCRWCGDFGGGRDHGDTFTRALRHCTEHPYHPSSLVPGTRCAQHWPIFGIHRPPDTAPLPTVYDQLVAAQQAPPDAPVDLNMIILNRPGLPAEQPECDRTP